MNSVKPNCALNAALSLRIKSANHRILCILSSPAIALSITLTLGGCAGVEKLDILNLFQQTQIKRAYSKANSLLQENKPAKAAQSLWTSADKFPPPHRQELQIRAGEILLDYGHTLAANRYLRQIDETPLDDKLLLKKRIAQAHFYNETGQYKQTLADLPNNLLEAGDKKAQIIALWLTAEALSKTDHLIAGIQTRIQLDKLISKKEKPFNTEQLWQLTLTTDANQARAELNNKHPNEVNNWLQLADLATPLEIDIAALTLQLEAWKTRNKHWPLPESVDDELLARWQYLDFSPKKVGVLLPLTGPYAKYGKAVRYGLSQTHNNLTTKKFSLEFRNTDTEKDITGIYQELAATGVELIIGPLLKEKANQLILEEDLPVPLITLNYSLENKPLPQNEVFRFGLLPEDETLQIAQKVRDEGHEFIVVLAPENPWGDRLVNTFSEKFLELGGSIRQLDSYDTSQVDYSSVIENLLLLSDSRQRHAKLSRAIGYRPDFAPRIRSDISAMVLLADAQRAALIYPQLKYHYADRLPTYSSSHVYKSAQKIKNRDLDGLNYLDAPIILYQDNLDISQKDPIAYPRLFALGVDTYHLINIFRQMSLGYKTYAGMTGKLSITPDRRLFRELRWAKFRKGKPVPLNPIY